MNTGTVIIQLTGENILSAAVNIIPKSLFEIVFSS
jgi:hypothetical protein